MKRANNLLRRCADPDNLRWAFYRASKGKRYARTVLTYQRHLDDHLVQLREQILSGEVIVGDYHFFTIHDPKEREICAPAFREQVLHHALMNVCHDSFEKYQIYDSYATRPEKGTYAALDRARKFTRRYTWFLKLDVKKYFASIDHDILKQQLRRRFKEERLLHIFDQIIDSYPGAGCQGVPIGNLTSQYFANHYLAVLDHWVKEDLGCPAYVRYMDDMVLWGDKKEALLAAFQQIETFITDHLQLVLKEPQLQRTKHGLPFLGYQVFPYHCRLAQRSKQRFIRKARVIEEKYHSGEWSPAYCQRRILPLIAFTRHADAKEFRKNVF